jgi:hypothetical protein
MITGEVGAVITAERNKGLWTFLLGAPFHRAELVLFIIAISLGVWWGQRGRLARYLAFILKILPEETRQAIVEIARDEALRAPSPTGRGAPEAVRA